MATAATPGTPYRLALGTEVEVHVRYDGGWASGFEIADAHNGEYQLRRRVDGVVLPVPFRGNDLRQRH
jgi:hypothetical protein